MSDATTYAREFWIAWRMQWVPRFILLGVTLAVAVIVCLWHPWPSPSAPRPANADSALVAHAGAMARVCHAWLRTDRTRRDSISSLNYEHAEPFTGHSEMCMNWMVFAGERP